MIENEINEQNLFVKQVSDMDQFNSVSTEMAMTFANFYIMLIKNGVIPDHALVMTVEYIKQVIQANKS